VWKAERIGVKRTVWSDKKLENASIMWKGARRKERGRNGRIRIGEKGWSWRG